MTDDEDKQLRRELLAADLELRRKQGFWETPRNIAILVAVVAAIAAAIGFWLGRDLGPRASSPTPVYGLGGFDTRMSRGEFVDAVQTAGILVIAAMLIYVVVRLDRTLTAAAGTITKTFNAMIQHMNQLDENVRRVWERIDKIEERLNQPKDN